MSIKQNTAFLVAQTSKESASKVGDLGWEDPLEDSMATHSSILAWRIHGQRSLAGCGPWGRRESDTTDVTKHAARKLFSVVLMVWDILQKFHIIPL